jgi:hypothetical protein
MPQATTLARVEIIRELAAHGLSTRESAGELSRREGQHVSKNVVVGICHRHGIKTAHPPRPGVQNKAAKDVTERERGARIKKALQNGSRPDRVAADLGVPDASVAWYQRKLADKEKLRRKKAAWLAERLGATPREPGDGCQFVIGDPASGNSRYCCAPVISIRRAGGPPNTSWCREHALICLRGCDPEVTRPAEHRA